MPDGSRKRRARRKGQNFRPRRGLWREERMRRIMTVI